MVKTCTFTAMSLGVAMIFSSSVLAQGGCATRHVDLFRGDDNTSLRPLAANMNRTHQLGQKPSPQPPSPPSPSARATDTRKQ